VWAINIRTKLITGSDFVTMRLVSCINGRDAVENTRRADPLPVYRPGACFWSFIALAFGLSLSLSFTVKTSSGACLAVSSACSPACPACFGYLSPACDTHQALSGLNSGRCYLENIVLAPAVCFQVALANGLQCSPCLNTCRDL
jgi:hypothetical protein